MEMGYKATQKKLSHYIHDNNFFWKNRFKHPIKLDNGEVLSYFLESILQESEKKRVYL